MFCSYLLCSQDQLTSSSTSLLAVLPVLGIQRPAYMEVSRGHGQGGVWGQERASLQNMGLQVSENVSVMRGSGKGTFK